MATAKSTHFLEIDGHRIATYEWGEAGGPLALFVHGWESNAGRWRHFIREAVKHAGHIKGILAQKPLAMSVRERSSENALLRVLGFDRLHVAGLLLLESLLYGVGGGLLGSGLTIGLLYVVASGLQATALAPVAALLVLRSDVFTLAAGSSLVLAGVAAAYPALLAGSGSLADQLRRLA